MQRKACPEKVDLWNGMDGSGTVDDHRVDQIVRQILSSRNGD